MLGHLMEHLATNDQNGLLLQYYIDDVLLWVRMRLGNLPPKRKKLLLHLIIGRLETFEHHNGRG